MLGVLLVNPCIYPSQGEPRRRLLWGSMFALTGCRGLQTVKANMTYIKPIVDLVINLGNKQISPTAVEDVLLLELKQFLHLSEFCRCPYTANYRPKILRYSPTINSYKLTDKLQSTLLISLAPLFGNTHDMRASILLLVPFKKKYSKHSKIWSHSKISKLPSAPEINCHNHHSCDVATTTTASQTSPVMPIPAHKPQLTKVSVTVWWVETTSAPDNHHVHMGGSMPSLWLDTNANR